MKPFVPTYLYVKRHQITNKYYFGKTTKDPLAYRGSGVHWTNHIKKYGKDKVETVWFHLFENEPDIVEYAVSFSVDNNIIESSDWLNLKTENGLDGGSAKGRTFKMTKPSQLKGKKRPKFSEEHLKNMSLSKLGKKTGDENNAKREDVRLKISASLKGRTKSKEHKEKLSQYKGEKHHAYGKKLSEEFKQKLKESHKNRKYKFCICPHCDKKGAGPNMTRYHFDNCKMKGKNENE